MLKKYFWKCYKINFNVFGFLNVTRQSYMTHVACVLSPWTALPRGISLFLCWPHPCSLIFSVCPPWSPPSSCPVTFRPGWLPPVRHHSAQEVSPPQEVPGCHSPPSPRRRFSPTPAVAYHTLDKSPQNVYAMR